MDGRKGRRNKGRKGEEVGRASGEDTTTKKGRSKRWRKRKWKKEKEMEEEDQDGHEKVECTSYKALSYNRAIYKYSCTYEKTQFILFHHLRTGKHLVHNNNIKRLE